MLEYGFEFELDFELDFESVKVRVTSKFHFILHCVKNEKNEMT